MPSSFHSPSVGLPLIGSENTDVDMLSYVHEQHLLRRLEAQNFKNTEVIPSIADAMHTHTTSKCRIQREFKAV